jgi:hypothetical protein
VGFIPSLSYIPRSMECDSRASFLALAFVSPCLDHKPKARVATQKNYTFKGYLLKYFK